MCANIASSEGHHHILYRSGVCIYIFLFLLGGLFMYQSRNQLQKHTSLVCQLAHCVCRII